MNLYSCCVYLILTFFVVVSTGITNYSVYFVQLINLNDWLLNFTIILLISYTTRKIFSEKIYLLTPLLFIFKIHVVFSFIVENNSLIESLWIGTLNIHPPTFYLSFILLFLKLYSYKFYNKVNFKIKFLSILIYLTLTLSLGGLWGLQSLAWGFFWVNDGIEWLLLISILLLLYKYHNTNQLNINKIYIVYYFFIISNLLFIRLNIISTRHSFLSNYNTNFLLILIYLYMYIIFFKNFKSLISLRQNNLIETFSFLFFYIFLSNPTYLTITTKYMFSQLLVIFLYSPTKSGYTKHVNYLHFLSIVTLLSWSTNYTCYYVNFFFTNLVDKHNYLYINTISIFNTLLVNTLKLNSLLEFVDFYIENSLKFSQPLLNNLYTIVKLNIPGFLIIILLLVFFKQFELRFLYKKETYI